MRTEKDIFVCFPYRAQLLGGARVVVIEVGRLVV